MTLIFPLDVTCDVVIWIVMGCLWCPLAITLFGAQDNDFGEIFAQICTPVKLVIIVKDCPFIHTAVNTCTRCE